MGARLNWIMHFGLPPRFNPNVRIIQLDIAAGEHRPERARPRSRWSATARRSSAQLNAALEQREWVYPEDAPWRAAIAAEDRRRTAAQIAPQLADDTAPINYYRALQDIAAWAPEDAIIVSEGANTMDIGRTQLPNSKPRAPARCRQLRHDGRRLGLRRRRRRGASRQADRLGLGRLGVRVLRHGDGDGLPLPAADQDRRASTTAASGPGTPSIRTTRCRTCGRTR